MRRQVSKEESLKRQNESMRRQNESMRRQVSQRGVNEEAK